MPQTSSPQKPTIRALLREAAVEFSGFDHGAPYTVKCLLSKPGGTVRRYLDTNDTRITRPMRLFLMTLVLYLAVASFGGVDEINESSWVALLSPYGIDATLISAFLIRYQTALYALVLPLMMLATRLAWPRAGRTLAEHLVLNTYLFSAQMLISVPLILAASALGWFGLDQFAWSLLGVGIPLLTLAYAGWMMATFFSRSRIWSVLRAIAIQFFMAILYHILVLGGFLLWAKLTGVSAA